MASRRTIAAPKCDGAPRNLDEKVRRARYVKDNLVPVAPFRAAFERSGMGITEFARRMGMVREQANIDQARRTLGIRSDTNSRDGVRQMPRQYVTLAMAKRLCDALDLDYYDADI